MAAATRVFTREGCGAPLDHVVKEAEVGRGTLYRHFPSREALIVAVLAEGLEHMAAFVRAEQGSPVLLREFLEKNAVTASLAVDAIQLLGENPMMELLKPLSERARAVYEDVIAHGVGTGEVPPTFSQADLRLVLRMVIGAATEEREEEARRLVISKALDVVLAGFRALRPLPSGLT